MFNGSVSFPPKFEMETTAGKKIIVDSALAFSKFGIKSGTIVETTRGKGIVVGVGKHPDQILPQLFFALEKDMKEGKYYLSYWNNLQEPYDFKKMGFKVVGMKKNTAIGKIGQPNIKPLFTEQTPLIYKFQTSSLIQHIIENYPSEELSESLIAYIAEDQLKSDALPEEVLPEEILSDSSDVLVAQLDEAKADSDTLPVEQPINVTFKTTTLTGKISLFFNTTGSKPSNDEVNDIVAHSLAFASIQNKSL